MTNRRTFVRRMAGTTAGLAMSVNMKASHEHHKNHTPDSVVPELPDNPLVLFDNFHVGNRRTYSWQAKMNAAKKAGFDGFEFAGLDPRSERWEEAIDLLFKKDFKIWGFHWTTQAVIDRKAPLIDEEIEKIIENIQLLSKLPAKPYFTLSLSGHDQLNGPTIAERGSAKAKERHWERAYKIIGAFDRACNDYQVNGSLYPHVDWICDTPQSAFKILTGAKASRIGPAFCSHHWYANEASDELDDVLKNELMKRLN